MGKGGRRNNITPVYPAAAMAGGGEEPIVSCPERGTIVAEPTNESATAVDGDLVAIGDSVALIAPNGQVLATADDPALLDCLERGFGYSGTIRRGDDSTVRIEFWQEPPN